MTSKLPRVATLTEIKDAQSQQEKPVYIPSEITDVPKTVKVSGRDVLARDNNPNRPMCFVSPKAARNRLQEFAKTDYEVVLLPTTEPIVLGEYRYMNMYYIARCNLRKTPQ